MLLLLWGLLLRLWLAHFEGVEADLKLYQRWAYELSYDWPSNYYDHTFTDYLPLYLYVLEAIGLISRAFGDWSDPTFFYAFRIPPIIADLASVYLLYLLLSPKPERTRMLAAATYLFLPTVLFIGAFWGQSDSLLALGLLACVYFVSRERPVATAVAFTLTFFMKPLAIVTLPVLAVWILRDYPPRVWFQCIIFAFVVSLALVWPFFPSHPWGIFSEAYDDTSNTTYSALNAYNFFGLFGWERQDAMTTWGISWRMWGLILTVISELFVLAAFWRARTPKAYALGVALAMLAVFTFSSRMHERYMFSAFLPLLAACVLYNRKVLWASFVALSVVQFFMLYQAYWAILNTPPPAWLRYEWLVNWLRWSPSWWTRPGTLMEAALSAFVVANVVLLVAYAYVLNFRIRIKGGLRIDHAPEEQLP